MVGRYETQGGEPSIGVLARAGATLGVPFEIEGVRIICELVETKANLQVVPRQLRLDFGKPRTFQGAIIEITPQKGKLFIRAEMQA